MPAFRAAWDHNPVPAPLKIYVLFNIHFHIYFVIYTGLRAAWDHKPVPAPLPLIRRNYMEPLSPELRRIVDVPEYIVSVMVICFLIVFLSYVSFFFKVFTSFCCLITDDEHKIP